MPKNHNDLSVTRKEATAQTKDGNSESVPVTAAQTELRWINGPIPSAEELAKYEAVLPGSAERFLQLHERQIGIIEDQAHHRFALEKSAIFGDVRRSNIGLILGFIVCLGGMGVSYSLGCTVTIGWLAQLSYPKSAEWPVSSYTAPTRAERSEVIG